MVVRGRCERKLAGLLTSCSTGDRDGWVEYVKIRRRLFLV
jgi:hypothetical protein